MFSKYATNLKTTIFQRSLKNSGLLLLLFEPNIYFLFLIDIIDIIRPYHGIRPYHVTRSQHSNKWQYSIIVRCLRLYLIVISFGIILTQFYINFSRQEHQIELLFSYRSWSTSEVLRFQPIVINLGPEITWLLV